MLASTRAPQGPLHQDPAAVRQARLARGMTQAELAQRVEITQSHMSELERGTRGTPPELLEKIAAELECPVRDLERVRPLRCPLCSYGHDPQDNGAVPLHTLDSGEWCKGGGTEPVKVRWRRDVR